MKIRKRPWAKDASIAERFMAYVLPGPTLTSCWIWSGARTDNGYGVFHAGERGRHYAHRFSYEMHANSAPAAGLFVCHTCDVKHCVNPSHLFLGTNSENIRDAVSKGIRIGASNIGQANGRAILTKYDVLDIRARRANGETLSVLAHDYNVSKTHIHHIEKRKAWSHI